METDGMLAGEIRQKVSQDFTNLIKLENEWLECKSGRSMDKA